MDHVHGYLRLDFISDVTVSYQSQRTITRPETDKYNKFSVGNMYQEICLMK